MEVRCWGARGSFPVSGKDFLKYGGDTACVEIRTEEGERILVDAGTGLRALGEAESGEKSRRRYHLFLTHAHLDHVIGFPFFKPLHDKSTFLDVYGPRLSGQSMETLLGRITTPPYFPVRMDGLKAKIVFHDIGDETMSVGSVAVSVIPLNHPGGGVGFQFEEKGRRFLYLTDNELTARKENGPCFRDFVERVRGADLLFHDAMVTDGEYEAVQSWGHSSFRAALDLAIEARAGALGFFHHHPARTDGQMASIERQYEEIASGQGSAPSCFAVSQGMTIIV